MLQTPTNIGNEYAPDVVSAPGETLQEILEERQMTQTELSERLGMAQKTVNEIIRGKAALSHETALGLETVLGIPASFWNNYETAYRESLARKEIRQRLAEYAQWLDTIPWLTALERGWIRKQESTTNQILEILRFFGVASPKQYDEVYGNAVVQWKRSENAKIDLGATAFWLRRGELEANTLMQDPELTWNDYDAQRFEQCLMEVRALTADREPSSFVKELQRLCSQVGVAVVFVPEIKGTEAGGAARWLSSTRALIQLSVRYKTNDTLWFYFFHEACHILKHPKKSVFIEQDGQGKDAQEREADEFAQNILIPPRDYTSFRGAGKPTKASVEAFASKIGVDPGIVVGRLQNDGLPRHYFNDLKQRYEWDFIL